MGGKRNKKAPGGSNPPAPQRTKPSQSGQASTRGAPPSKKPRAGAASSPVAAATKKAGAPPQRRAGGAGGGPSIRSARAPPGPPLRAAPAGRMDDGPGRGRRRGGGGRGEEEDDDDDDDLVRVSLIWERARGVAEGGGAGCLPELWVGPSDGGEARTRWRRRARQVASPLLSPGQAWRTCRPCPPIRPVIGRGQPWRGGARFFLENASAALFPMPLFLLTSLFLPLHSCTDLTGHARRPLWPGDDQQVRVWGCAGWAWASRPARHKERGRGKGATTHTAAPLCRRARPLPEPPALLPS